MNVSSTNLCRFQAARVQRQCLWDSLGTGLAGDWDRLPGLSRRRCWYPLLRVMTVGCWGVAQWRVPVREAVCTTTSPEFKALDGRAGGHGSIICALQMGCCSVAGAKRWMRAAWCWQGTPCSVLLGSLSWQDTFCWSCFSSKPGVCFLYGAAWPILGGDPEPLCFPKGFFPYRGSKFAAAFPIFEQNHCSTD